MLGLSNPDNILLFFQLNILNFTLKGDQGGPLTVPGDAERVVIGIHSYTFSLGCELGWPAVYTRTGLFLDWIQANTNLVLL